MSQVGLDPMELPEVIEGFQVVCISILFFNNLSSEKWNTLKITLDRFCGLAVKIEIAESLRFFPNPLWP